MTVTVSLTLSSMTGTGSGTERRVKWSVGLGAHWCLNTGRGPPRGSHAVYRDQTMATVYSSSRLEAVGA
eukprot:3719311-Rhodomonas_salina.3